MNTNGYFFGFSRWKRRYILPFFQHQKIHFCTTLENGQKKGLNKESKIYIWGKKPFSEVEAYAYEQNISLSRVEDGFVRSFRIPVKDTLAGQVMRTGEPLILNKGDTGYVKAGRIHDAKYIDDCKLVYVHDKAFGFNEES